MGAKRSGRSGPFSTHAYFTGSAIGLRDTSIREARRPPLNLVAIHEAGHAVAAFYLGIPFGDVTIIPVAEQWDSVPLPVGWIDIDRKNRAHRRFFEAAVVMSLAGTAAEDSFFGDYSRRDTLNDRTAALNYALAGGIVNARMVQHLARRSEDALAKYFAARLAPLASRTFRFVARHRGKIAAVAVALLERGRLTERDVEILCGPRAKPRWQFVKAGEPVEKDPSHAA